jgi:hypothetical protein
MAPEEDAPQLAAMLTEVGGQRFKDLLREVVRDAPQELL